MGCKDSHKYLSVGAALSASGRSGRSGYFGTSANKHMTRRCVNTGAFSFPNAGPSQFLNFKDDSGLFTDILIYVYLKKGILGTQGPIENP